jgi:hypothetical protein
MQITNIARCAIRSVGRDHPDLAGETIFVNLGSTLSR